MAVFCVARDLVKKLLVVNPTQRLSIEEALKHPWLEVRPSEKLNVSQQQAQHRGDREPRRI